MVDYTRQSRRIAWLLPCIAASMVAACSSSTAPTSAQRVSPATAIQCLGQGGVGLSVPTNSPYMIPSGGNGCSTTIVMQYFWELPGGSTGSAYAVLAQGRGSFLPTAISGTATSQPVAIFYGWFACPTGYGPVLPGTATSVSYSTGNNYECLSGVPPSGSPLTVF